MGIFTRPAIGNMRLYLVTLESPITGIDEEGRFRGSSLEHDGWIAVWRAEFIENCCQGAVDIVLNLTLGSLNMVLDWIFCDF